VTESEPATEGYINIFDAKAGGRLVTVIEFLSPSNKLPGEGQKQYRQKQQELRQAGVSLVEIDLLRGGEWVVDVPPGRIPRTHRTPYKACVRRGRNRGEWEFYRLPLDQPLPAIRIPLREKDADARLDLQMLINQTYANGAYDALDYTKPTDPPLEGEAAAWVNELLKSHRR
ncbi:MAG: DUF4058 family protein, partial [Tepidisphaeraceae bacterium]